MEEGTAAVSALESPLRHVDVGPFRLVDATRAAFVTEVAKRAAGATSEHGEPVLVYALHVGGLNSRNDRDFVDAMSRADLVYADGGSAVWLAKLAGAEVIERAPTTDVGWDVLRAIADVLGRPVRLALVGGPEGLAERASQVLAEGAPVEVVLTEHGYHQDWSAPLEALRNADPDVCLVGLGAPGEMLWCERHRSQLPGGLVLTCGGWFGHLVGDERRAPRVLRRSGVEWVARLAQSPRRLGPRYARGIGSSAVMSLQVMRDRSRSSRR
jgi:N-acetylglucosaminyldiphosphoundecaprenol N-acetyl-beta-D-mannosaminyltransferase